MNIRFARFRAVAIACTLLAAVAGFASAQDRPEGRGFFMAGAQGMDIDELNSRLSANGYATFPETFTAIGGGGYGIIGRVLLGGEGMAVMTGDKSATIGTDYYKTTLAGGFGMFRLGYIVYRRGGFILYPAFGIGGGGFGLEISKDTTEPFDNFLANPQRRTSLGTGFLLLDFGIGADHLVILDRNDNQEGGIAFGARAGYKFSPYRSGWGDALNGPDCGIEGAYVCFTFGGGGR